MRRRRRPQFNETQRATIHSIGMDIACIISDVDFKAWSAAGGQDSRSVYQAATEASMAIAEHIHATGKDVFADEDIDFTTFSSLIAARIEAGDVYDWTTEIPKMIAQWILDDLNPICNECQKPIAPSMSRCWIKGKQVHPSKKECRRAKPARKQTLSQADFDALVDDEMSNDADAGGDAATRREYAEGVIRREYIRGTK